MTENENNDPTTQNTLTIHIFTLMSIINKRYNVEMYINELMDKKEKINHIILKGELSNQNSFWNKDNFVLTAMLPYLQKFLPAKTFKIDQACPDEKIVDFINNVNSVTKVSLILQDKKDIPLIKKIKNAEKIEVEFKINQEDFTYKLTEIPQSARNWIFEQLENKVLHPPEEMSNNALIGAFIKGETTIEMPNNTQYGWLTFSNPLIINLSSNGTSFQKIPLSYAQTEGGIDFLASFFTDIPYEFTRGKEGFTLMKKNDK